ncbi:hypothetical protein BGX21_002123 [Mortierella sp. AD011]|nr:hypothetical protein BGX21_002123 [Mortierella sp. AD011]
MSNNSLESSTPKPIPSIPIFPYFPPAIKKYSPELSPSPSDANESEATAQDASTSSASTNTHTGKNTDDSKIPQSQLQNKNEVTSPTQSRSPLTQNKNWNKVKKPIVIRAPFPARAPPPPRSVTQLEEAMTDLKVYDCCLFWSKSGAVNLIPDGNSWDDDMVIQTKDPAWVRNLVKPPNPTNPDLMFLPPMSKIERSIAVFNKNSHLFPPHITPLIVERARKTRFEQVSLMLLNTIIGIAIRIDPSIENDSTTGTNTAPQKANQTENKAPYTRYFDRAYGIYIHLEDIRSTFSTTYSQATLLLCFVYPNPRLRIDLLRLINEAIFLGTHIDASRWMPKPIILQNRCWLFWMCYIFDSVHYIMRGQLTQLDDHYLDPPFPALTEFDHDDGLWTSWFMVKEINLWRIGKKIHSFFQAGLKRMDRLIESDGMDDNTPLGLGLDLGKSEADGEAGGLTSLSGTDGNLGYFSNIQDFFASEYSEAELILSLKSWTDDLPVRLTAQLDNLDFVDPRVNGRAVGLQAVYSILRILLLYPNILAVGTDLLSMSPKTTGNGSTAMPAGQNSNLNQYQQYQQHQKHQLRRQALLDRILQCVQEADRVVLYSTIILERYPERAGISCIGVALDWCLRIYHKIITEERIKKNSDLKTAPKPSSVNGAQPQQESIETTLSADQFVFSPRLKIRCRTQVAKVARLLKQFEEQDPRYYFSWLTVEPPSLVERQRANQQKLIQKCLDGTSMDIGGAPNETVITQRASNGNMQGSEIQTPQQQQQQKQTQPKHHDLQAIIKKRQQMGVYANSGIRPNGGNYIQMSTGLSGTSATSFSATVSPLAPTLSAPSSLSASPVGSANTNVSVSNRGLSSGIVFSDTMDNKPSMPTIGVRGAYSGPIIGEPAATTSYPTMSLANSGVSLNGLHGNGFTAPQQPIYHFEYHTQTPNVGGFQNGHTATQFSIQPQAQAQAQTQAQTQQPQPSSMAMYSAGGPLFSANPPNELYSNFGPAGHQQQQLLLQPQPQQQQQQQQQNQQRQQQPQQQQQPQHHHQQY